MSAPRKEPWRWSQRAGLFLLVLLPVGLYVWYECCVQIRCYKDHPQMTATMDVNAIANAVDMYQVKHSRLPEHLDQLVPNELREIPRRDPWGHSYAYEKRSEGFSVVSLGRDGIPSGDDIRVNSRGP